MPAMAIMSGGFSAAPAREQVDTTTGRRRLPGPGPADRQKRSRGTLRWGWAGSGSVETIGQDRA